MTKPRCTNCKTVMNKDVVYKNGLLAQLASLAMILIGLGMCLTCIGGILGAPCVFAGIITAGHTKVWKCSNCAATIDRA